MRNADSESQIGKGLKASRTNHRYLANLTSQELSSSAVINNAFRANRAQAVNNPRSSGSMLPAKSGPGRTGRDIANAYDTTYSVPADQDSMRDYDQVVLATGFSEMPLDETANLRKVVDRKAKMRVADAESQLERASRTVN